MGWTHAGKKSAPLNPTGPHRQTQSHPKPQAAQASHRWRRCRPPRLWQPCRPRQPVRPGVSEAVGSEAAFRSVRQGGIQSCMHSCSRPVNTAENPGQDSRQAEPKRGQTRSTQAPAWSLSLSLSRARLSFWSRSRNTWGARVGKARSKTRNSSSGLWRFAGHLLRFDAIWARAVRGAAPAGACRPAQCVARARLPGATQRRRKTRRHQSRARRTLWRRLGGSCCRTSFFWRRTMTRLTRWWSSSVLRLPACAGLRCAQRAAFQGRKQSQRVC